MIVGAVSAVGSEPRIDLVLLGPGGERRKVSAVVDTGFTGAVALDSAVVAEFPLPFLLRQRALLADGSEVLVNVYEALVDWDGGERPVRVVATAGNSLVGMALLRGYELNVQVAKVARFA